MSWPHGLRVDLFHVLALQLDLTVTLGNIVQLAGYVLGIIALYNRISVRLAVVETKVDAMWERRKAQTK